LRDRGEKAKQKWGREEQRLVVTAQRRRRTVPHHLGTTAMLPLHRHNSTVLPVIGNSPCTVRNRKRNPEKTETEEEEAAKQRRRRTTVAPP
jgi:hypothetical protein